LAATRSLALPGLAALPVSVRGAPIMGHCVNGVATRARLPVAKKGCMLQEGSVWRAVLSPSPRSLTAPSLAGSNAPCWLGLKLERGRPPEMLWELRLRVPELDVEASEPEIDWEDPPMPELDATRPSPSMRADAGLSACDKSPRMMEIDPEVPHVPMIDLEASPPSPRVVACAVAACDGPPRTVGATHKRGKSAMSWSGVPSRLSSTYRRQRAGGGAARGRAEAQKQKKSERAVCSDVRSGEPSSLSSTWRCGG
jgi:hypothetical protein